MKILYYNILMILLHYNHKLNYENSLNYTGVACDK